MFLIIAFNTLSKLTEPRSGFNRRAESLAQREKHRFDDRSSMVRFIINPSIVSGIKRVELSMLDYWSNTFSTQFMTEFVPVEAFVGDHSTQAVEISRKDLPRDLCVVWKVL